MNADSRTYWLAANRLMLGLSDDEILWAGRCLRAEDEELGLALWAELRQ